VLTLIHGQHWTLLNTGWGAWYLLEMLGFVLLPGYIFYRAVKLHNTKLIRVASLLTLLGIILNRLNISVIAFQWQAAVRYVPSWMEIEVTLAVISAEIWVFRWVVNRMPVLGDPPAWAAESHGDHAPSLPAEAQPAGTGLSKQGR